MSSGSSNIDEPRPLTPQERELARWLLEQGGEEARPFFAQLDRASATTWRCPCGCASYNFAIEGLPRESAGVHILADFVYDRGERLKGVFIYESAGVLSGVELVDYTGYDTPRELPSVYELRPFPS